MVAVRRYGPLLSSTTSTSPLTQWSWINSILPVPEINHWPGGGGSKNRLTLSPVAREGWLAAIAQWLYTHRPIPVGLDLEADRVLDDERPRAAVLASRRHKHNRMVVGDCLHGE